MNITKRFADWLFALGFRVAYSFFRRTNTKAVKQARPDGALDWFAPPSGTARIWEAALADAQRQQAMQSDPTIR